MTRWTDNERAVVRECWTEEEAFIVYRQLFPKGDKSITAIIREWNRAHPKTEKEAQAC